MRKNFCFILMAMLMALTFFSCSEEETIAPEDAQEERDWPEIPKPASYDTPNLPSKSDELIVESVLLTNFQPNLIAADTPEACRHCASQYNDSLYYTTNERTFLVENNNVIYVMLGYDCGGQVWCLNYPLSERPYLQLVRYWVRLGDVEHYAGGTTTTETVTRSTTKGITESSTREFGMSIGVEVGASYFVEFSTQLNSEFSESYYNETSFSEEVSMTVEFTISVPIDKNVVYTIWQPVEEFRLVDSEGELYTETTDPNYVFSTESIMQAIFRLNETIPVTTFFDQ